MGQGLRLEEIFSNLGDVDAEDKIIDVDSHEVDFPKLVLDLLLGRVCVVDQDFNLVFANRDTKGKCYEYYNRSEPCENCPVNSAISTGKAVRMIVKQDERYSEANSVPVRVGAAIRYVVVSYKDVTGFEHTLRMYRELWENANDIFYVHDLDGNILAVNKMAAKVFGYSVSQLERMNIRDIVDESYIQPISEGVREIAEKKKAQKRAFEILCKSKDGRDVWIEVRARPLIVGGRVVAIHGIARDVTFRKDLEKKLCESEEMFRKLAEKSLVGIYLIQDGVFKYVNPKLAELWGYKQEELLGSPATKFVHPDDRELVERNLRLRLEGKVESVNYTFRVIGGDGEVRVCEVYGSRTTVGGKPAVIGTLIDITDRIRMEEEIRRLNNLLKLVNEINQLIVRERDVDLLVKEVARKLANFYHSVTVCYGYEDVKCHSVGREEGKTYVVTLPLSYNGDGRGVLIVRSTEKFLRDEVEILKTLAGDLAFAIEAAKVEEEKWIAFEQIEQNIEQFAILVDQIRNPLAVISLITEMMVEGEVKRRILSQVRRIEELISKLDKGWLESETIREYLSTSWERGTREMLDDSEKYYIH